MRCEETAHFEFGFENQPSKKESLNKLKTFLKSNGWLTDDGSPKLPLNEFHTEQNVCSITLAENQCTQDLMDQTMDLYESLVDEKFVKWIKVELSKATERIVYNKVDKYANYQSFDIVDMKIGDMVLVYRKCNK